MSMTYNNTNHHFCQVHTVQIVCEQMR